LSAPSKKTISFKLLEKKFFWSGWCYWLFLFFNKKF